MENKPDSSCGSVFGTKSSCGSDELADDDDDNDDDDDDNNNDDDDEQCREFASSYSPYSRVDALLSFGIADDFSIELNFRGICGFFLDVKSALGNTPLETSA